MGLMEIGGILLLFGLTGLAITSKPEKMITTIILYDAKLTPTVDYFLRNLSYLKDNITIITEIKSGLKVSCNFKAGKRKQNEIKKSLKYFTESTEVNFVTSEV